MRSKASARHISATPSSDDSENSCISASTPDARVRFSRTDSTSLRASAWLAVCETALTAVCDCSHCTASRLVAAIGGGDGGAQGRRILQDLGMQRGERK